MNDQSENNRTVAILGMHRCGTSTITRAFNLLGVYLGEEKDFIPPDRFNREGYWERKDFCRLQNNLLATLKRSWDTGVPLPEKWQHTSEVQQFKKELITLIRQNFSGVALWGWKDPRSTILIELWKNILEELSIELSVVFAVRNPLDVALSLKQRENFSFDKSFGIWFNYNIIALHAVLNISTAFISYDRFLSNWESELKRCSAELNILWPEDDSYLKSSLSSFVRPELRHSHTTLEDLHKAGAPVPVCKLYELLLKLLDGEKIYGNTSETILSYYNEFYAYTRFYQYESDITWNKNRQLQETENNLNILDFELSHIKKQLAERGIKLDSCPEFADYQTSARSKRVQELLCPNLLKKFYSILKKK
jgi:hypothetical protein